MSLTLLLIIAATVLSLYQLIEARGRGAGNWALALLSVALLWPHL